MKKEEKEQIEPKMDLTFCWQSMIIIEETLNKLNYVGNYTYSNSKGAMSKSIGQQIDNKMKRQQELEKDFENLILQKSKKVDLIEEKEINDLVEKIKSRADDLKVSTLNICKSLAENPNIPKNLEKAKDDQKLIISKIVDMKSDLVYGQTKKFDEITQEIIRNSINIEEKRKDEMNKFKKFKKLNEDIKKEEEDYVKDQKEMNKRLFKMKNTLAQTKLEENIFTEYRKNQINALDNLYRTNFNDEEKKLAKDIEDRTKERVNLIFYFILGKNKFT
jgi:hypothetical protein